jgi:hypothetical protein
MRVVVSARLSIYLEQMENLRFRCCVLHYRQLPGRRSRDHLLLDRPINFRTEVLEVILSTGCATIGKNDRYFVQGGLLHQCGFLGGDVLSAFFQVRSGFGGSSRSLALQSFGFSLNHSMLRKEATMAVFDVIWESRKFPRATAYVGVVRSAIQVHPTNITSGGRG